MKCCARCGFFSIKKENQFVFDSKTYQNNVKVKLSFFCSKSKTKIDDPVILSCDNFETKDEEEQEHIQELIRNFETKGW